MSCSFLVDRLTPEDLALLGDAWRYVDRSGPNGCWLWTGKTLGCGRVPVFRYRKTTFRAAYLVFALLRRPSPGFLHNECGDMLCVNPDHQSPFPGPRKPGVTPRHSYRMVGPPRPNPRARCTTCRWKPWFT